MTWPCIPRRGKRYLLLDLGRHCSEPSDLQEGKEICRLRA